LKKFPNILPVFRFILIPFGTLFFGNFAFSQKEISISKTSERIQIDGKFTENTWKTDVIATDFSQITPTPGSNPSQKTEVRLSYDDHALYIAVNCIDEPHLASKILSLRDDFHANIDNFKLFIDTYNDDQNGFVFGVSSMGVQYDAKIYQGEESPELNMVWNSEVVHTENGWQLEIRIPYSAIRFPKTAVQNWGVNFERYISRNREVSSWNPVKPDFENYMAQCGQLKGVEGIAPPLRLALIPYLSGYVSHYPFNEPTVKNVSEQLNGGMDIKLGLNEAFTLDMTLVPDFGQVVFDNQVLNLSPFEIQFNENRQFFTEGTELFNKSGLFYSRRIGIQAPSSVLTTLLNENEILSEVPQSSQLYNASKISGRTKKGLGIGVFNGITAPQKAKAFNLTDSTTREILVSPLTNYNVLVLDQNLKNNSSVTLTNTNVTRSGSFYDANVTGIDSKFNTKDNRYFVGFFGAVSGKYYNDKKQFGHTGGVNLGKQTGNFTFSSNYYEESDTYDPNDLGFLMNNNSRVFNQLFSYRIFKPFWRLNRLTTNLNVSYSRLYKPDVYVSTVVSLSGFVNTKKFHAMGFNVDATVTPNYDYFEPRVWGKFFTRPKAINYGAWISTNYQKKFALDVNTFWTYIDRENWQEYGYGVSPRWRISNQIFLVYELEHTLNKGTQGFAVPFGIPAETTNAILFGNRDRTNVTNTINLRYTFTKTMGFTFRLRHYRSNVKYNYFYDLQDNGNLARNTFTGLDVNGESAYNTNFNAFTIDMVYRWVFKPGSEINVVWKNSIFTNDKRVLESYMRNLNSTFENGALNSISIKVIYWLDYQSLKSALKKKKVAN
jgi:hypothetical protein